MTEERGVIEGLGVLDLSHLTSKEELAAITRIDSVGAVVVPESLAGAYAAIPASGVGGTVYVPDGVRTRVHVGSLIVGGDGVGSPDEVLVVVGSLVICSPVTGELPQRISVVGSVLAPRGSETPLGRVVSGGTGTVGYFKYVEGQQVKLLSGQVRLSAAMLANTAGDPSDVLVAAGQVIITGEVGEVGFSEVFVAGQVIAPEAAQPQLEARMQTQGQVVWYRSGELRLIMDDIELGADFFTFLERPVTLIVFGDLTISAGVTTDLLREKVGDIVLFGDATAPADVVGALQVLTSVGTGQIRAAGGSRQ